MKMDRTLIEQPSGSGGGGGTGGGGSSPSRKGPQPQPQQHGNSNASSNSDANPSPSRTTSWIDSLGSGEESSSHHQEMIMNDTQARGQHEEQKLGEKGGRLTRGSGKGSTTSSIRGSGTAKSPTNTTVSDTKSTRLTSLDSSSGASPTNTAFNNTTQQQQQQSNPSQQQQQQGGPQTTTTSFRRLNDFLFEDPAVYTQSEIRDILDMINDGNKVVGVGGGIGSEQQHHQQQGIGDDGGVGGNAGTNSGIGGGSGSNNDDRGTTTTSHLRAAGSGQGLKPVCKAYGILGFIRFLDCYYLTLITKRAKVGSIGGNSIYTIKVRRRRRPW